MPRQLQKVSQTKILLKAEKPYSSTVKLGRARTESFKIRLHMPGTLFKNVSLQAEEEIKLGFLASNRNYRTENSVVHKTREFREGKGGRGVRRQNA